MMALPAAALSAAAPDRVSYTFVPDRQADRLRQVVVAMKVDGVLLMVEDAKEIKLPMSVAAAVTFQERLLPTDDSSTAKARAIRYYDQTKVAIKVEGRPISPDLRPARRRLCASLEKDKISIFSPAGPLSRDELELVELPADSLVVDDLLPATPVHIGDAWQPSDGTLAALLGLEAVGHAQVSCKLAEVADGRGRIELSGNVDGATGGVSSRVELKGDCHYELGSRRIVDCRLVYHEKRATGYAAPGVDATAQLQMRIAPLSASEHLSDAAIQDLLLEPTPKNLQLEYESSERRFRLLHDRLWHVAREDATTSVLRRVDRGDLVAQCNITALLPGKKDRRTTIAKFQEDIQSSLGRNFGQFVGATENQDKDGRLVYRVDATGHVSELPVEWIYYLIQDAEGRRTALVFTLDAASAKRFGQSDRPLVQTLTMLTPPRKPEAQPTPAAAARSDTPPVAKPAASAEHSVTRPPSERQSQSGGVKLSR